MLPFGTPPSKTAEQVHQKTMRSTVRNLTNDRKKVESFIKDEENPDRRADLTDILEKTQKIVDKYDGHRYSDMKETPEYKSLTHAAFEKIQGQRFSGRKIFFVKLSNPVFGLETSHFYWFLTKQGVQVNQLDFMTDFINELKPTPPPEGMKNEFIEHKPKPMGLVNVPKSKKSCKTSKNKKSAVYINHLRLREALDLYIKGVFRNFGIPMNNVECTICTSELPDKVFTKANMLIDFNLVYEDSHEPLDETPAVEKNCDEFGFWTDSSGDFDRSVEIMNANSANNNNSNNEQSMRRFGDDIFVAIPTDNLLEDYWSKVKENNSKFLESAVPSNDSIQNRVLNSTPTIPRSRDGNESLNISALPRPNESIIHVHDVQNVPSLPLPTPQPVRAPLTRSISIQPVPMDPLLSEDDSGDERNQTAPARPSDLDQIVEYMDRRFNFLEKSFKKE